MSTAVRKVKTGDKPVTLINILNEEKKRARLFLLLGGLFLLALGFSLSNPNGQNTTGNASVSISVPFVSGSLYPQEPIKIDGTLLIEPLNKEKAKNPPIRILIPSIGIDLPVKEAKIVGGYWELFEDSAGFGLGSAYPEDEGGNVVIFAHARENLFAPLKKAKIGQTVYVVTKTSWFTYKTTEIKEATPKQTEVIASTKEPVLTLYTCSGFADSKRLIVIAKKE